jgi:Mg-chelatase subunit ChlD
MLEPDTPSGRPRLEISQAAAITFICELQSTDRVAVVPYSTTAHLASPLTADQSQAAQAIANLTARWGGFTNIGAGIKLGHTELVTSTRRIPETVKAIILLSDGNANRPEGIAEQYALAQAEAAAADGIGIYTIGLGDDANAVLLDDIATLTGGKYYFTPDGGDLEDIYLAIVSEF